MREIKFRAWDKLNKDMFNVESINFQERRVYKDTVSYCKFENIDLMQYTGLKDEYGDEIYEGDIVKFKDCSIDGTKEFYNIGVIEREGKRDELVISQLIFEKSYFTENYMDFINETFELSEIIGNIYENPELLKEKEVR